MIAFDARQPGDPARPLPSDARAQGLRPADVIIALHEVQFEVALAEGRLPHEVRDRVHTWLVRACMRAYFGERT